MFEYIITLVKITCQNLFLSCFQLSKLDKLYLSLLLSRVLHIGTQYRLIWSASRIWASASESRHPDIKLKAFILLQDIWGITLYCLSNWIVCDLFTISINSAWYPPMHESNCLQYPLRTIKSRKHIILSWNNSSSVTDKTVTRHFDPYDWYLYIAKAAYLDPPGHILHSVTHRHRPTDRQTDTPW